MTGRLRSRFQEFEEYTEWYTKPEKVILMGTQSTTNDVLLAMKVEWSSRVPGSFLHLFHFPFCYFKLLLRV